MPGILDILAAAGYPITPADPSAQNLPNPTLWGALNQPSPLQTMLPNATGQAPAPPDAAAYGSMGVDPTALLQPQQTPSAFPAQPAAPAPSAAPSTFGAGASPFSFAGPGSSAMPAAPAPQPMPSPQVQAAPAAAPAPAAPAMNANAQAEAADPIAIGKYQMPRIGAADDFEPDDATPAAATPTAGRGTPGAATAPAPFSFGGVGDAIGDRLSKTARGFLGNLAAGPVGALAGGLGALVTGRETDPSAITAQHANVTAQALISKGASPADVAAAANNPELLKALIGQYYGRDKFQPVNVKNADGSETPQAFDVATGKYSGATAPAPSKFSVDPTLTGKDRLEALRAVDPLYARKIESMVAGDLPMPTGVAALRPDAKRMIEDALAVDGSTSASDFQTRAATRKDYASGIASRVTKSINTTIGHFATLDQGVDKLGNYSYFPKIANAVHDAYSSNMDPAYQRAKATFETNKEAAVKELDFALSGGHSSVSGSAELRDKFNRADSPEALHAAITEAMSLLQKRLESHTKAFTEGTKSQRDPQDFIYPENQQAFSRMLGGQSGATIAPGATAPPPPGSYVWTPGGGLSGGK